MRPYGMQHNLLSVMPQLASAVGGRRTNAARGRAINEKTPGFKRDATLLRAFFGYLFFTKKKVA